MKRRAKESTAFLYVLITLTSVGFQSGKHLLEVYCGA
jgi:hypothetical protein